MRGVMHKGLVSAVLKQMLCAHNLYGLEVMREVMHKVMRKGEMLRARLCAMAMGPVVQAAMLRAYIFYVH